MRIYIRFFRKDFLSTEITNIILFEIKDECLVLYQKGIEPNEQIESCFPLVNIEYFELKRKV